MSDIFESRIVKSVNRLLTEWNTHGYIIVGVDFDDTIVSRDFYTAQDHKLYDYISRLVRLLYLHGNPIICCTSRPEASYDLVKRSFNYLNIPLCDINKQHWLRGPEYKDSKVFTHILLDDRAGLVEAVCTLSYAFAIKVLDDKEIFDVEGKMTIDGMTEEEFSWLRKFLDFWENNTNIYTTDFLSLV